MTLSRRRGARWRSIVSAVLAALVLSGLVSQVSCAFFVDDAKLSRLVVYSGSGDQPREEQFYPGFDPVTTDYRMTVFSDVDGIMIDARAFDSGARVTASRSGGSAVSVPRGSSVSDSIPLEIGENVIVVRSRVGNQRESYRITVTRPDPVNQTGIDPRLRRLDISDRQDNYGRLIKTDQNFVPLAAPDGSGDAYDWGFDSDHYHYVAIYPQDRNSISITPAMLSRHGRIYINDTYVPNEESESRSLQVVQTSGDQEGMRAYNDTVVKVLAQDGATEAFYRLRFYREPSDDVNSHAVRLVIAANGSSPAARKIPDFQKYYFVENEYPPWGRLDRSIAAADLSADPGYTHGWSRSNIIPYHGVHNATFNLSGFNPSTWGKRATLTLHHLDDDDLERVSDDTRLNGVENLRVGLNHLHIHVQGQDNFVLGWDDEPVAIRALETKADYYTSVIRSIALDILHTDNSGSNLLEDVRGLVVEKTPYFGLGASEASSVTLYLPNDGHDYTGGGGFTVRLIAPPGTTSVVPGAGAGTTKTDSSGNIIAREYDLTLPPVSIGDETTVTLTVDNPVAGSPENRSYEVSVKERLIQMVDLEGYAFTMGQSDITSTFHASVSSFSIGKYVVSYGEWKKVVEWAEEHAGYEFEDNRLSTQSVYEGYGALEGIPVHNVYWYDALKWCNALSEMEGLSPVYYTGSNFSEVYRTGRINLGSNAVNWDANGYRLPTEVEWEFAARNRGANPGNQPAGGADAGSVAWFADNSDGSLKPRGDKTPVTTTAWNPGSTRSGLHTELFDMSGNVREWVWDRFGPYPTGPEENYRGPDSGNDRSARGGSYKSESTDELQTSRRRDFNWDSRGNDEIGFRVVRSLGHYDG